MISNCSRLISTVLFVLVSAHAITASPLPVYETQKGVTRRAAFRLSEENLYSNAMERTNDRYAIQDHTAQDHAGVELINEERQASGNQGNRVLTDRRLRVTDRVIENLARWHGVSEVKAADYLDQGFELLTLSEQRALGSTNQAVYGPAFNKIKQVYDASLARHRRAFVDASLGSY